MSTRLDLSKQVGSLDMLISAIKKELHVAPNQNSQSKDILMKEMEEALRELRRARNLRKVMLRALEPNKATARRAATNGRNRSNFYSVC